MVFVLVLNPTPSSFCKRAAPSSASILARAETIWLSSSFSRGGARAGAVPNRP